MYTPVRDYPAFQAALSFLPALPPDDVAALLRERAGHLEGSLAQAAATRELAQKYQMPRLIWGEIESGAREGIEWWRAIHEQGEDEPMPSLKPDFFGPARDRQE